MGIFSRLSDIVNSNLNAMLDKAEDPEKMIRLIIQEMEETLVEVRSGSVRLLADRKALQRRVLLVKEEMADWGQKARLALSHQRDDLARAALAEQQQLQQDLELVQKELMELDEQIAALDDEISQLQQKLEEAKSRQQALVRKVNTTTHRMQAKRQVQRDSLERAFSKFDQFEQKIDRLEGELESMDLGRQPKQDLHQAFADLETEQRVEAELAKLKAEMAAKDANS